MNLPENYIIKMKNLLGGEFDDYLRSFDEKRYYGLRANTLKIEPEELVKKLNFNLEKVRWCEEGFYYSEEERPSKHPYYNAGLFYIQEPSAMSTGAMLNVEPGDRVLDLCAAPGGKSTQAGAKLKGEGILVSNDISASRCRALLHNIEAAGISNAVVTNETPKKLADKFQGFFNKIIVDAPCSGEGMFRKDKDAIRSWEEHKSEVCCSLQRDILRNAAKMLSKGGVIAYSTCTFAPEEDEGMINEFLSEHCDFDIIEIDKSKGFDRGRSEWVLNCRKDIDLCGRLWPYKIKGEGHFLALLRKRGSDEEINLKKAANADLKLLNYYYDFMDKFMNIKINDNLEVHGHSLMRIPLNIDFKGIRVVRGGLYIGDFKTKRFEPSQSFAMSLKKEDVKYTVDFALDNPSLIRYLKGESFEVESNDGWNLICVDGFPLGWGKVQKGRMKNKYLPSWKI
ncbi:MAG: SAM-dependent methyltransferase [Clostridiales bacterium]|nr:SAM-dependent methyltransferase [Clostridiales bacterium]